MAYGINDLKVAHSLVFGGTHPFSLGYGVRGTGAVSTAILTLGAAAIGNAFRTRFQPAHSPQASHVTTTLRQAGSAGFQGVSPLAWVGTSPGGQPLPNNVCMCISLRTSTSGPSGRGRCYMGAKSYGDLNSGDSNTFGTSHVSGLLTAWQGFVSDLAAIPSASGGPYQLCVDSRKLAIYSVVNSISIDPFVDTQRRRVRD